MTPDRVIRALAQNPGLYWQVLQRTQVLGPWVVDAFANPQTNMSHMRWDPWKRTRCTLRYVEGEWVLLAPHDGNAARFLPGGFFWDTPPFNEANQILRDMGFCLLEPEDLPQPEAEGGLGDSASAET